MGTLILAVVILIGSVVAALWFRDNAGLVYIEIGQWQLETSVIVMIGALLLGWLILNFALGFLWRLWRAPRGMRHWVLGRRYKRARQGLVNGLVEIAEGQYGAAERTLLASSEAVDMPVFNYLLAALAAQRRGAWEARDEYLRRADESEPRARVAVGLLQARLQADAEQWEQALATLSALRERIPANRSALALMARTLEVLGDWERLGGLLPELRRREALPEASLDELEQRVFEARLASVAEPTALDDVWEGLSRDQKRRSALRAAYARALVNAGRESEAHGKLKGWLRRGLEARLLRVWGELSGGLATSALRQTEKWLQAQSENPELLYAAGRLAAANGSWERARFYLEAASARLTDPQLETELAEVLERLGAADEARHSYRRALGREPSRAALPAAAGKADGADDAEAEAAEG
jgi:HemY protein